MMNLVGSEENDAFCLGGGEEATLETLSDPDKFNCGVHSKYHQLCWLKIDMAHVHKLFFNGKSI